MSYYPADVPQGSPQERYQSQPFKLTPEEQRILKECSKEGIFQRAIPMGVAFGLGGLMVARAGPLMSKRYGVKPAVIGFGILGYMIGRFSYSKICIRRCLEVPDGNLKKLLPHLQQQGGYIDPTPDAFYLPVEVPKNQDPVRQAQSQNSDIDIPTMSNWDTIPSEYYEKNAEKPQDDMAVTNYTSYDDLRKQNRIEYSQKYYGDMTSNQSRYPNQPQDGPVVRRPTPQEMQPTSPLGTIGGRQTKYGDIWDA
ncbi:OCIA domain-containing protein 1 isoform X1 [Nasonia vitripennis]|uniref:OCIA domain-containing protein n=2 Tax=Nasonia vitripennis TaxID=7425 RepID=A0A7M7HCJ4_NASVI|nr:OCIA domain-containing protein 1 isoform X1 [Nasonia vitripennis]XP_008210860.1 OCIA domain-containing protein 1 isoform X1 [Nasonia vitripennis]